MDTVIFYLVAGGIVLAFQVFKAINKGKNQQAKGKVKNSPRKSRPANQQEREMYRKLGLEDLYEQLQGNAPKQKVQSPPPPPAKRMSIKEEKEQIRQADRAFLQKEIDSVERYHYAEKNVISRIEAAHKQGKEMEHHTHGYLKPDDDAYEKDYLKEYVLPETGEGKNKKHPITKLFQNRKSLRNAIIMNEILEKRN